MRPARLVSALGLVAVLYQAPASAIDIPANTWVAVPLPGPGHMSACDRGECKHERVVFNSFDGRTYWLGGDHSNPPGGYGQSGSNEMWSYSIHNNDWRLETPYCLGAGYLQPSHPDEVGFAYDSRRRQFWMYPGYEWDADLCPSTEVYAKPMFFDVGTGLWSDPELPWDANNIRFMQYDPVGDRMLGFEYGGSPIIEHNLSTGTVSRVPTIIPAGEDGDVAYVHTTYTALDLQGRKMYVIAGNRGKLYRYDLETNELKFMTTNPVTGPDEQMLFWDPASQVLLWPYRPLGAPNRLFVWHPGTNAWTEIPITPPVDMNGNPVPDTNGNPLQYVIGRQGVFDPVEGVMMITGFDTEIAVPYLFLYRYSEGPPDTTPPSAPTALRTR